MFSTIIRPISGPGMSSRHSRTREEYHWGIECDWALQQISSACVKLTYPCRQVWRMLSPCGQNTLVDTALPHQATVWAITVSYFHICYLSFVQGQKVERVDNMAGWWRRELLLWQSSVVYETRTGSCSEVTRVERVEAVSLSVLYPVTWSQYHAVLFFTLWSNTSSCGLCYFPLSGPVDWHPTGCRRFFFWENQLIATFLFHVRYCKSFKEILWSIR